VPVEHASRGKEGPRERLERLGPQALAEEELVALVLGHGVPGLPVLTLAGGLLGATGLRHLARRHHAELARSRGVGRARAARLVATFEIARRINGDEPARGRPVRQPRDLAQGLQARYAHEPTECFGVVLLDSRNRYLGCHELSRGGWSASVVRPREVFRQALLAAAPALVLFHNHPSGDPTPSRDDLAITGQLRDAGELLGIRVLDHLIVGAEGFVSLRERGVL
jgi:DNA repair protein RadC